MYCASTSRKRHLRTSVTGSRSESGSGDYSLIENRVQHEERSRNIASVGAAMGRAFARHWESIWLTDLMTYAGPIVSVSVKGPAPILPRVFASVDDLCAMLQENE